LILGDEIQVLLWMICDELANVAAKGQHEEPPSTHVVHGPGDERRGEPLPASAESTSVCRKEMRSPEISYCSRPANFSSSKIS
jgi:hypothetical protein